MLTVEILCVGKLREGYLKEGCERYRRMASTWCDVVVTELPESKIRPDSQQDIRRIMEEESRALEKALASRKGKVFALCVDGESVPSARLAREAASALGTGTPLVFVIGGSHGFMPELEKRADIRMSMSAMTFPHQLARLMLLEQIYRAFNTAAGGKYAK